MLLENMIVLLLALAIDLTLGEFPRPVHPVVWMGRGITFLEHHSMKNKKMYGILMVAGMTGASFLTGAAVVHTAPLLGDTAALLVLAYFLKSTFSFRMLLTSARQIMNELESGNSNAARKDLKMLVSRDTKTLDNPHIASAVIETTSENFVDGIISPLFYFIILGIPGALAYKAVNTLDSMVGYRNKDFIELGWASARLDDYLNWIPARLSLIFIFAASFVTGNPAHTVKICIRDRNLPSSPNSGWPMAAASGALEVKLQKQGQYVLGKDFSMPENRDIEQSTRLIGLAALFVFLSVLAVQYVML